MAVALIHGFGDPGDVWSPLAARLAGSLTVIVPDLRGMGLSSTPALGCAKRSQAQHIRTVLTSLGQDRDGAVGHDIGTMVAACFSPVSAGWW